LQDNNSHSIRLQKYLSNAGVCSRRKAERLILAGKVKVDGKVVPVLGTKVQPGKQKVTVNGRLVRPERSHIYLVMNKPRGVLTTMSDPHGRPTIVDLIKDVRRRVYPVGRLDMDSEGLLFLTDDGELAYRLLHPSFKVPKKYVVTVRGLPSKRDLAILRSGVEIEPGIRTKPCTIKILGKRKSEAVFEVTLTEGRKRQIRLMFKAVDHPVTRLKRTEMGPLRLGGLRPGTHRSLTPQEIGGLKKAAGLS